MIEDTYALLVDAPKTGFENRLYGNGDAGNKILESLQTFIIAFLASLFE